MTMERLKESIASLIFVALIIAALALSLDSFESDIAGCEGSDWYNSSDGRCYTNSTTTNTVQTSQNTQTNISNKGLAGIGNASDYLSTIGTLIGVSALVAVVVMAFYIARR